MSDGDTKTAIYVLAGAAVTTVLMFVPFSPVLGGGVAGYLKDEGLKPGGKIGLFVGIVSLIPYFGLLSIVGSFGLVTLPEGSGGFTNQIIFLLLYGLIYYIILGAVGGGLGGYIKS